MITSVTTFLFASGLQLGSAMPLMESDYSRGEERFPYGRKVIVWGDGMPVVSELLMSRRIKVHNDFLTKNERLPVASAKDAPAVGTRVIRFTLRGDTASNSMHSDERPICNRIAEFLKNKGKNGGCMMK